MDSLQTAARALTTANLGIGVMGFLGPFVSGNRDRVINLRPGLLYGIFAMNWAHALLHLGAGVAGLPAWNERARARSYLRLHVGLFGTVALYAWPKVLGPERIRMVMGMALDPQGNAVHTLWAVVGAYFSRD